MTSLMIRSLEIQMPGRSARYWKMANSVGVSFTDFGPTCTMRLSGSMRTSVRDPGISH